MNPFIRYALEKKVVERMQPKRSTRTGNNTDTRNSKRKEEIDPKYSLAECILLDMADEEDTILLNFLEKLKEYSKAIDDRDARKYVEKVEEIKAKSAKKTLEEKQKELEREFDNVSYYKHDLLPTYKNPMKDSEIEYIEKITVVINGVAICSKTIEEDIRLKQEKYQKLNNDISEFRQNKLKEIMERNAKLEKQKIKLLQSLSRRFSWGSEEEKKVKLEEINDDISSNEGTLRYWNTEMEYLEKLKNDINMLQNLKPDQIKLIDDFLKVKDEMDKFPRKECFELYCHIRAIYCYDESPGYYNGYTCASKEEERRKYGMALEKMIEDKSVSEEEIWYVADKIGEIREKRQNLEYNEYRYTYKYLELDKDLKQVIGRFLYELKKEYEEYKLEKNKNTKLVTSKDIAESSKQEEISLTEVNAARVTVSKILAKEIFGDKGEKND